MRKALYLFGSLTDEDVSWIATSGHTRDLAPGETLIAEGREVGELYIVLDGVLTVHAGDTPVSRLRSGELVGEMSFVEEAPPTVSVTSDTPSRVLALSFGILRDHAAADAAFAARLYRGIALLLSDRLRGMTGGFDEKRSGEDSLEEGELSGPVMETLASAGQRFSRLQTLLGD